MNPLQITHLNATKCFHFHVASNSKISLSVVLKPNHMIHINFSKFHPNISKCVHKSLLYNDTSLPCNSNKVLWQMTQKWNTQHSEIIIYDFSPTKQIWHVHADRHTLQHDLITVQGIAVYSRINLFFSYEIRTSQTNGGQCYSIIESH